MTNDGYLLGIDMGTGSARAGIFDTTGKQMGFGTSEFATTHRQPSWAEQDPQEWWRATVEAIRKAVSESGVDPKDIRGISMDGTSSTVVFLDENDHEVRPAILWMDVRSVEQAEALRATDDPALKYCGEGPVSAEWGLPKAMWVKQNEPEVFARTKTICDLTDWVVNKFTGKWTMSVSHAAAKYFYDGDHGGWPTSLYEAVDATEILDKFPQEIVQVGTPVGGLLPEVAEELGLAPGTPVIEGAVDAYVGALGLGVAEPGRLALITGSSHVITGQLAKPLFSRGVWGTFTDATVPGFYTVDGGQVSTGSVVAWFRRTLAGNAVAEGKERGVSAFDVLTEGAKEVPIGSDGLMMLDHFQGNRAPYFDARSRGVFWGLTLSHTEAHMFRAILEGICYGTEAIFQIMRDQGTEINEVVVSGGAVNNPMWLQMHADVSNLPLVLTNVSEGPVLGSAMIAAVGVGIYPDLPTASAAMSSLGDRIEPNPEAHEAYKFYYQAYRDTYPAMQELLNRMSRHVAG